MDAFVGHALSVFMGFFAIMNPIANTPVFLGLTAGYDPATQRKIAAQALIVSFVITLFLALRDFPWQKFLTKTDFWSVGHDKKWLIVYPEVLCNPLIFRP
jgi:hypothetical protein